MAQHSKFEAAQVDESRIVGFKILRESTEEKNAEAILDLIRSFAFHLQLPIVARNRLHKCKKKHQNWDCVPLFVATIINTHINYHRI